MRALVRVKPWDVRQRLAALCGVEPDVFVTALRTGQVAYLQCTDNDPPFIPGTYAWARTLRSLREQLVGLGWHKEDAGNYSLTISDTHRLRIAVSSGDEMTGLSHGDDPKTKAPKGVRTENAVERNAQGDLFPETLGGDDDADPDTRSYDAWVFLIHVKAEEIRAELSRPVAMEDGHISEWSERIILPVGQSDPEQVRITPDDFGPDIEPAIRRIA